MTERTVDQKSAEATNRLQRQKTSKRTKDTRRKIIVGAVMITEAFKDPRLATYLADVLEAKLTRDVDRRDAAPLVADLRTYVEGRS